MPLFHGGRIVSHDPAVGEPQVIVVEDGRIAAAGDRELRRAYAGATETDLRVSHSHDAYPARGDGRRWFLAPQPSMPHFSGVISRAQVQAIIDALKKERDR